jgi:hypothetical protein
VSAGRLDQVDRGARRGAERDERSEIEARRLRIPGGEDDVDDILLDLVVHVDLADDLAHFQDLLGLDDGLDRRRHPPRLPLEDLQFLLARG